MTTFLFLKPGAHAHYANRSSARVHWSDLCSGSADRSDGSSWKQKQEINFWLTIWVLIHIVWSIILVSRDFARGNFCAIYKSGCKQWCNCFNYKMAPRPGVWIQRQRWLILMFTRKFSFYFIGRSKRLRSSWQYLQFIFFINPWLTVKTLLMRESWVSDTESDKKISSSLFSDIIWPSWLSWWAFFMTWLFQTLVKCRSRQKSPENLETRLPIGFSLKQVVQYLQFLLPSPLYHVLGPLNWTFLTSNLQEEDGWEAMLPCSWDRRSPLDTTFKPTSSS